MSDPVLRRIQCVATLYLEAEADGLSLARLVVDVALPDPSVIVANLPESFDQDHGDAWEAPAPEVEADAAEALAFFPRLVQITDTRGEVA
jgi:hypothetical protein